MISICVHFFSPSSFLLTLQNLQMGIDAFSWLHKRDKYKSDFGIVLKFTNCNVIPIVEIQHCYSRHISWEKPPDSFDGLSCGKAMAGQSSRAGRGVFYETVMVDSSPHFLSKYGLFW